MNHEILKQKKKTKKKQKKKQKKNRTKLKTLGQTKIRLVLLTLFFPMFPLDPPENIRNPKIICFQEDQKGTLGRKGL